MANPQRAFFNVLLVSATGAGKTQLMSQFIGQGSQMVDRSAVGTRVVKALRDRDAKTSKNNALKFLSFTKITEEQITTGQFFTQQ